MQMPLMRMNEQNGDFFCSSTNSSERGIWHLKSGLEWIYNIVQGKVALDVLGGGFGWNFHAWRVHVQRVLGG